MTHVSFLLPHSKAETGQSVSSAGGWRRGTGQISIFIDPHSVNEKKGVESNPKGHENVVEHG